MYLRIFANTHTDAETLSKSLIFLEEHAPDPPPPPTAQANYITLSPLPSTFMEHSPHMLIDTIL